MSNAFQNWLGKDMAAELTRASFIPVQGEEKTITHRYTQSVLMTHVMTNAEEREAVVQHYLKFFEEIVEKLQVQAAGLGFAAIYIDPYVTEKVVDVLRMYLEKVMSGHPTYVPYLDTKDPKTPEDFVKGVEIVLCTAITKPAVDKSPIPEFYWYVGTEAWEVDKTSPNLMNKVFDIETTYMS